jgi:hypothetical protein
VNTLQLEKATSFNDLGESVLDQFVADFGVIDAFLVHFVTADDKLLDTSCNQQKQLVLNLSGLTIVL